MLDSRLNQASLLLEQAHRLIELVALHLFLHLVDRQPNQSAPQRSAHLIERQDVMKVERNEGARRYLEQLKCVNASRELLSQVEQVVDAEQFALCTFDSEAYLLVDLLFVHELHQIVITEVGLLVVVQINQESLDDFIDSYLRNLFRLDLAEQISEDPIDRLEPIHERYRVHHLNLLLISLCLDRIPH